MPVIEEETIEEVYDDSVGMPPIYGRCPVCGKPLFPRDRVTGQARVPPVGTGYESRAKCGGCGTILVYLGSGKWRPLNPDDISDEDKSADSFDKLFD